MKLLLYISADIYNIMHTTFITISLCIFISTCYAVPISQNEETITNTVIDVLSNNVEFSTFLRIVQRKGLVPILNRSANFTLLLPVNSAFAKVDSIPDNFDRYIINEVIHTDDYEDVNSKLFTATDNSPTLLNWNHDTGYWQFDDSEIVDANLVAETQNSVVHGLDSLLPQQISTCDVLTKPHNISSSSLSKFETFQKIMVASGICKDFHNLTGFIPLDSSLDFNQIELNYLLRSKQSATDRLQYLNNHFVEGLVGGNVTVVTNDLQGNEINITTSEDNGKIINNNHKSQVSDFLTSDGVLHFFNDDSFVRDTVVFTPRKYLHGLNVSSFVKELDFRKLSYLIDDNEIAQTIFVNVGDDEDDDDDDVSSLMLSVHKNNDLYQFVQNNVELTENVLLDSKYCYKKIGNQCQKIKVSKIGDGQFILNNHVFVDPEQSFQVGNTRIYLIDDNLTPPARLDLSIGPYYHSSRSVRYLNDLDLINLPNNKEGYTLLIPENDAWESLEMTLSYLLQNKTALSLLMKSTIINGLVYTDFEGELQTTSLDGNDVAIWKSQDQLSVNNNLIKVAKNSDILFAQGVAHSIKTVIFPDSLEISLINLLHSTNHKLFSDFLQFANLNSLIEDGDYSLILPTESSLLNENVTMSYGKLDELLKLHLIPLSSVQSLLDCESKIPTFLNDTDLSCRELTPGVHMLQILEGNDKEVRIINKGCTSTSFHSDKKQCLFVIDRPISPEWRDKPFIGIPHIKLPAVAMGIGAILTLIMVICVLSCCLVFFIGYNNTEDSTHDDADLSDDEHRQLLRRDETMPKNNYGSNNYDFANHNNNKVDIDGFSEQQYSDNAQSKAIDVKHNGDGPLDGMVSGSVNGHHDHQKKNFW